MADPKTTPLHDLHTGLGARMVPFAGWMMPLQYKAGIMKEHAWCREAAALFDVSHMGQVVLRGENAAAAIERLVPGNITGLKEGRARYTMLTDDKGGILDDLIVTRTAEGLYVVVNAGCRDADIARLREHLSKTCEIEELADRALIALQGPKAVDALARLAPEVADLVFMQSIETSLSGIPARVSRLGYTGEDGYEISVAADHAQKLARTLLAMEEVEPAGLGARDSLRLEAGLCLYGHDIDTTTTPVEAALEWSIGKRRREEGGFPGAEVILGQLKDGAPRRLVGLKPEGRMPVREGAELKDADGRPVGKVTSGGFGPTVGAPVAMGYVETASARPGARLVAEVRGRPVACTVAAMPFVPHRYRRGS